MAWMYKWINTLMHECMIYKCAYECKILNVEMHYMDAWMHDMNYMNSWMDEKNG